MYCGCQHCVKITKCLDKGNWSWSMKTTNLPFFNYFRDIFLNLGPITKIKHDLCIVVKTLFKKYQIFCWTRTEVIEWKSEKFVLFCKSRCITPNRKRVQIQNQACFVFYGLWPCAYIKKICCREIWVVEWNAKCLFS